MSTDRTGVVPTRRRGHDRVAAIVEAAAGVFARRGFHAATMTEIAEAASTAIGSLYRFFPTKELLADAVFGRYADAMLRDLDTLVERVPRPGPTALADALVACVMQQRPYRDAAVALADERDEGPMLRLRLRASIRDKVALILASATGRPAEQAARMAPMVLQAMKAVPFLLREGLDRQATLEEAARMIACYVAGSMQASARSACTEAGA